MRLSICIVSPGNLASNPRLLKEADALHEAGYAVTAIVCEYTEALRPYDDVIAARIPWKAIRVSRPAGEGPIARASGVAAKLVAAAGARVPVGLAARAYGGPVAALQRAAIRVPAALYIAHYVPGLAAAATAAHRHGAKLGFDGEDFHSGEATGAGDAFRMRMVRVVEGALLPSCVHATAAAPLIADAYATRYGISPATVLNVFPLAMAPAEPCRRGEQQAFRAYWFSQTVGLDRGLQSFIRAMARARAPVTLDIRGSDRWNHGARLLELARELGVADRIRLLPTAPPADMVTLAASYDIGLSLETDVSENRGLCLTNKIFTYLLAGVPVLMSDTPAQRALAPQLGAAARLVSLADTETMAVVLDGLACSAAARAEAAASAWRLGRERYNWDVEKAVLLGAVDRALRTAKAPEARR